MYNILSVLQVSLYWCHNIAVMDIYKLFFEVSAYLYKAAHDDVINWKHFPRYWAFVRGIHRSPVNSPHKGQ